MNNIPPLDLARQYQTIRNEVEAVVLEVMASGRYVGGSWVSDFERQFADYIGTSECVACNSGTDALYLTLRALDIGPGDEVITTAFTFFATTEVISQVGATPVFVDIAPSGFNLDVERVAAAITPRTRAILLVHLFGQPVEMTRLMAIAASHQIPVIEDCAQSTGATWKEKKVGSIGDMGCFSFFPTKNLGAFGDGGAVTTNDAALAAKMRVLKDHGATKRYYHEQVGANSRLDALQAAILQVKLPYLEGWNQRRRAIAKRYHQLLAPFPGIVLPQELEGGEGVWNQYTIRVKCLGDEGETNWRDRLQQQLQQAGVAATVYYPFPLHLQPVYRHLGYSRGQLPACERASREVLSLPMFPELSVAEQDRVVYCLKDAWEQV
ncbi:DegT/DnrJ/EryC1/StrS family aminotransferase [Phormidium sp. CCY1219]|uniref:DegT/DnrJ/EryC1/StrS family aminotransferase n=1 Tax=Phormidium sp. CCY1219 TaxID=2886104 RepID=UPI002D1F0E43|nr:DegT/DnrJ/EryC1/StrS family aminotransferase [Phormidium sp. CCY1219]MEB3826343.1 DegT/DnrJ/EryC1/StrS family aminotransferase [Phormidium sp. CCY1219]